MLTLDKTYIDHAVRHLLPDAHVAVVEEGVLQHLVDVATLVLQAEGPVHKFCAQRMTSKDIGRFRTI